VKAAFDNSFLVFLFNRRAGASVERAAERVDGLIESLSNKKAKIIIPTPALTELLMAGKFSVQVYVEKLKTFGSFQIRAYDERAAIELAAQYVSTKKTNKEREKQAPWNKIKFDRQIVAIAKTQGVSVVYSDDDQLRQFARECGMDAYGLAEISVPPQQDMLPGMRSGEDDEEGKPGEAISKPTLVQRGGSRSPKNPTGAKAAKEPTHSKEDRK
jgi:predicted nucleic acid-binding protein